MNINCPHRPHCPGCPSLDLPYEEQLKAKEEALAKALSHYTLLRGMTVDPCLGTEERAAYRRRVKWAVQGTLIGLYGRDHEVIDTPLCPIATPAQLGVADCLRGRDPETGNVRLGALDIRTTQEGQTAVTLVIVAPDREAARTHGVALGQWLRERAPGLASGVAWSWRHPQAATTLGAMAEPLWGDTLLADRIGLVETLFPPGAFSQVHSGQTARLHGLLRETLMAFQDHAKAHLVDLYAGSGSLGLSLAGLVDHLTLVESYSPAAEASREAARRLGVRVSVLPCPASEGLSGLSPPSGQPLVTLLNPPRTGLGAEELRSLIRLRPERIIYISCEPRTLARDLAILATHGMSGPSATPIDMLPGTDHVETMVALSPGPPPGPAVLGHGQGVMAFDKPPFLPTVPQPEWPLCLRDIITRDHPAMNPCHRLDEGTSGLVIFGGKQPHEDPLRDRRKLYITLVKGITHKAGTIARPLKERGRLLEAKTIYRRTAVVGGHSLLEVELLTGRTHQIRKHFKMIGHPVLGDRRYGDGATNIFMAARHGLIRPFLHASRLLDQKGHVVWESPLAEDLVPVLERLGQG